MGTPSKHNVIKVEERLPRPSEWVIVITATFRCMGYIDETGTWRDVNRNAPIQGVQAWSPANPEEELPGGSGDPEK